MDEMKSKFLRVFLFISILLVFLARFHVAITRYFDPDEFAHLHWTWLVATGNTPYRDFFFYATPLYQWLLWPLFVLPPGETILLLARIWQFGLYCLVLFLLYRITLHVTRLVTVGLLTVLIFITFPMTFDKTIDIRPDMLMTLLYFSAIYLILYSKKFLLAGFLLGTSFLVFFKIIYALPAALVLVFIRPPLALRQAQGKPQGVALSKLSIGLLIPLGLFVFYLITNNLQTLAWETFTHTQFIVNTGKDTFSLWATLSPWPLVYLSKGGVSIPWLVNIGVWIAGLFGIIALWKQQKPFAIFSICFAASAIGFLVFFPAPYVQYFIPLSVIASILAAVVLNRFSLVISFILMASFFLQYKERTTPASNNAEQLQVIRDVLTISKPTDTFYDMVGSYVFRPDGYFICCHPYQEFIDKLKIKPLSLRESLIANKTKFVILDRTGQSLWKPKQEDLDFLLANYKPSRYPKIYFTESVK